MSEPKPEAWQRGPVPGVPALLQPVAHALVQAREEVDALVAGLPDGHLWSRPAGVASPGFHVRHMAGVLDRLFTYARGEELSPAQRDALAAEAGPAGAEVTARVLADELASAVERALDALRQVDEQSLTEPRAVGRKRLPSTVLGLLFHAAEHTQRHVGQLLVTVRVLQAEGEPPRPVHGNPHGSLLLVPHAPEWAGVFAREAERIRAAVGERAAAIEHVGSTSVPGLLAKPIVDVAMAVHSEEDADACVAPLRRLGYEYRGMHGDDPSRRYYVLDRDGRRLFQLHVWILPTPEWERHLAFRDLLRARPDLAEAYAAEKLRVAEEVGWDKGAYSLAKGPFIDRLLPKHRG